MRGNRGGASGSRDQDDGPRFEATAPEQRSGFDRLTETKTSKKGSFFTTATGNQVYDEALKVYETYALGGEGIGAPTTEIYSPPRVSAIGEMWKLLPGLLG